MAVLAARRPCSVRIVCQAHSQAPRIVRPAGERDVRAGAAPHAMPAPIPAGAAGRPVAPLPLICVGEGLAPEAIATQMREHLANFQHQAIATHIEPTTYARVRTLLPGVVYNYAAKTLTLKSEDAALQRLPGTVGVVGGPSEAADVERTKALLQHLGVFVISKGGQSTSDARALADAAPALQVCDVVIVVAGADAALPSAVASLVDAPVLAAPTSEGAWSPPRGGAPVAAAPADGGVGAAVMAAKMLRTAAARALHIAQASAAAGAAAAHAEAGAQA